MIDIDPQGNSTSGVGLEKDSPSIYEVLVEEADIKDAIIETSIQFLKVVRANINLVGAEIELINFPNRERLLKTALDKIKNDFDFIIIDCPPSLGFLTLNSLTAADTVLIPVQCEYFALEGLGQLLNTVNIVRQHFNPSLGIEGVLLTMFDNRLKLSSQVTEEVQRFFGERVFNTIIHRNVRISEAPSHGKPIILYDVLSVGSKNYMNLATELLERNQNN